MESRQTAPVEVGDVFRLYGEQFRSRYKLPLHYRKTMFAIQHCRTPAMGSHADTCDQCGHIRITNNSCRNRHCPKCQGLNRSKWVDKLACDLLPVRYFHIVFTIPSELNYMALVNKACLYDILFKAASESITMLARDSKYLGAYTGMVAVLHTWGQNLMEHPHLHMLVPAGGWNETTQYWKASRKKFFIPVKVISSVFKGKFLSLLKKAYHQKQLKFYGEIKTLTLQDHFKKLLDVLYNKDWVVFCKSPFKSSAQIINYLGRYTHRVAISNNRILGMEDKQVLFRWKNYAKCGRQEVMKLNSVEFIRRFLLHVLPKGFCKIRYYGIFSARNRKHILPLCRIAFGRFATKYRLSGLSWQEVLFLVTGVDVSICPLCKSGKMIPAVVFGKLRAPP